MSGGIIITDPPAGAVEGVTGVDDPYLIEVVAPIESETQDATLAAIRGDVPAERATLEGLSDAIDQQTTDLTLAARRIARRTALLFG